MATLTKDAIIDAIGGMSVLEVSELVKAMEDKFGVSASAATVMAAPAATDAAGGGAQADEADKPVAVILKEVDASKKIPIIKEVRTITGLGLKDAKDLVEASGSTVKEEVPRDEAEKIKSQLESAGATVELR